MKNWQKPGIAVIAVGALMATVLASVAGSTPPAYEQTGVIAIELGDSTGTAVLNGSTTQTFGVSSGCEFAATGPEVLALSGSNFGVGFDKGSIGVQSKRNGRNCGQLDGSESLTLALGSAAPLDQAIFRAELDLELQQDAVVTVDLTLEGAPAGSYTLLSGDNVPGGLTPSNPASVTDASPNAACNPQSSSGPNSDSRDNCRLVIEPDLLFDSLTLTIVAGKVSLEGGTDGTAIATGGEGPGSLFFLAETFDGILDCGDVVDIESGDLAGVVTRLDDSGGGDCDLKPYNFEIGSGEVRFEPVGFTGARYSAGITKPVTAANPLTLDIEYDRDGDGTAFGFSLMQWCTNATIVNSTVGGEISRLVTDADLPAGQTWCIAAVDVVEDSSAPGGASAVFWVYGEDDPHWR